MCILGQTLTPDSKTRVLGKAVAYGVEWLGNESVGKREDKIEADRKSTRLNSSH